MSDTNAMPSLHYLDLGVNFNAMAKFLDLNAVREKETRQFIKHSDNRFLKREGSIQKHIEGVGQEILVQIVNEPISTKRATIDLGIVVRRTLPRPLSHSGRQSSGLLRKLQAAQNVHASSN